MRCRVLAVIAALLSSLSAGAAAAPADLAAKVEALAKLKSATQPSTAPDGRSFVYLSNVTGSPQAWIFDRASGDITFSIFLRQEFLISTRCL